MSRRSEAAARSDVTRLQTTRHWRGLLAGLAVTWVMLLVASPGWTRAEPDGQRPGARALIGIAVWSIADRVCHQRPERSFHLRGHQMAVCGRCFGLYVSGAAALVAGMFAGRRRVPAPASSRVEGARSALPPAAHPRITLDARAGLLTVAALPTLFTWAMEFAGVWDPGTIVRALAAVPLGGAAGWLIARALDE